MATHSSILAWRIPWTEEPGRLQSIGSPPQSDTTEVTHTHTHTCTHARTHFMKGYLLYFNVKGLEISITSRNIFPATSRQESEQIIGHCGLAKVTCKLSPSLYSVIQGWKCFSAPGGFPLTNAGTAWSVTEAQVPGEVWGKDHLGSSSPVPGPASCPSSRTSCGHLPLAGFQPWDIFLSVCLFLFTNLWGCIYSVLKTL